MAWRDISATAVREGPGVDSLASFAELVFSYIDRLSASSVAGHADERATSGRVRQGYLQRLAAPRHPLTGAAVATGYGRIPPRGAPCE